MELYIIVTVAAAWLALAIIEVWEKEQNKRPQGKEIKRFGNSETRR